MIFSWTDLTVLEREIAAKVAKGLAHDGNWEFFEGVMPSNPKWLATATPREKLISLWGAGQKTSNAVSKEPTAPLAVESGAGAGTGLVPVRARKRGGPSEWVKPDSDDITAVNALFLIALLTGQVSDENGSPIPCPFGVTLRGVRIDGPLRLRDAGGAGHGMLPTLRIEQSLLMDQEESVAVDFSGARLDTFSLSGSLVRSIKGEHARVGGTLDLSHVVLLGSPTVDVALSSIAVAGSLRLTRLRPLFFPVPATQRPENPAEVSLRKTFTIELRHAHIHGLLDAQRIGSRPVQGTPQEDRLQRAEIDAEGMVAETDFDLFLAALGHVALDEAVIRGKLRLQRCLANVVSARNLKSGPVDMTAMRLTSPGAECLDLSGSTIEGSLYFGEAHVDRFVAQGSIDLTSCKVRGSITAYGASISVKAPKTSDEDSDIAPLAFTASHCEVDGDVKLEASENHRFESDGTIFLSHSRIRGCLMLDGARISVGAGDNAIVADTLRVEGAASIDCDMVGGEIAKFEAVGSVSFIRSSMGTFSCLGAVITSTRVALDLCSTNIPGGVFGRCEDAFPGLVTTGSVRLVAARIGLLDLEGAQITCSKNREDAQGVVALDIAEAQIGGKVRLNWAKGEPFRAVGEVRLRQTVVEGDVSFSGGVFEAPAAEWYSDTAEPDTDAIDCAGLIAKGDVFLSARHSRREGRPATQVVGTVRFDRGQIDGDLVVGAAILTHGPNLDNEADAFTILSLKNTGIAGDFAIRQATSRTGLIDFTGASLRAFDDEGGAGWGAPPEEKKKQRSGVQIRLDSCRFQTFAKKGQNRVEWLQRQFLNNKPSSGEFFPHAYVQTAKVLRDSGFLQDSRAATVAQRRIALRAGENKFDAFWSSLYGFFFDFGQGTVHALTTFLFIWLIIGSPITNSLISLGWLVDASPRAIRIEAASGGAAPSPEPARPCGLFAPLYALDRMLVVVDFDFKDECDVASDASRRAPTATLQGPDGLNVFDSVIEKAAKAGWIDVFYAVYGAIGTLVFFLTALTFSGVLRRERND
jgi:hypothetical protein